MSHLSERPRVAVVGEPIPHESAALHVTGDGAVHRRPRQPHARTSCTRTRCRSRTPTPGSPRCAPSRRSRCPAWSGCSPPPTCPGVNDAGVKHDEPLFPSEVMFYGHAVCWVLGETLEAARLGAAAVEVDVRAAARRFVDGRRGDRRAELPGRAAARWRAATSTPGSPQAAHVFSGEFEFAGQEHFYLETHARSPTSTRAGRSSSRAAPSTRRRRRRSSPTCSGWRSQRGDRAVPADGRRLRRQGDAAARLRRGRRARRDAHRPSGPAAAQPHPGPDHVRQAARVPRRLAGRASTTTAVLRRWTRP